MITLALYKKNVNGKLVFADFGTKPDASLYVRMGYVVKSLNE